MKIILTIDNGTASITTEGDPTTEQVASALIGAWTQIQTQRITILEHTSLELLKLTKELTNLLTKDKS